MSKRHVDHRAGSSGIERDRAGSDDHKSSSRVQSYSDVGADGDDGVLFLLGVASNAAPRVPSYSIHVDVGDVGADGDDGVLFLIVSSVFLCLNMPASFGNERTNGQNVMRLFLFFLVVLGAVSTLVAQDVDALINEGLQLEKQGETDAAIGVLQRAADLAPENAQVTKLLARQYVLKIEDGTDATLRKKYAELAVSLGQKAADKLPNDAEAQASLAASYGKLCELVNPKLKIEYSKKIYAEASKAVTLDPNSDFGHMILGCWNIDMVSLNPFLRGLVQIVYGQFPPATKEGGIAHFKRAIELAPQRIVHHAEYAKALDLLGDRQDANREWTKVTELKPIWAQDRRYQVQAIERLKR